MAIYVNLYEYSCISIAKYRKLLDNYSKQRIITFITGALLIFSGLAVCED